MKKFCLLFSLFIVIWSGSLVFATDSTGIKSPFNINSLKILESGKNKSEVTLEVNYASFVTAKAIMQVHFSDHLSDKENEEKRTVEFPLELIQNITQKQTVELKLKKKYQSILSVTIYAENLGKNYIPKITDYIEIDNETDTVKTFQRWQDKGKRKPIVLIEKKNENGLDKVNKQSKPSTQNYTINVYGKVKFKDPQSLSGIYYGVQGVKVKLWFRNSNNSNSLYHPVYGDVKNVHYDEVDHEGNYNFSFSFSGDLTLYNQIMLLVTSSNSAAILDTPDNGYIVGDVGYFGSSEGVLIPFNNSLNTLVTKDIEINSQDGDILRNMYHAREFIYSRYNVPVYIPQIRVKIKDLGPNVNGLFQPYDNVHIELAPNRTWHKTSAHEYGHFVNYLLWEESSYFAVAEQRIIEGFAEFYCGAVMNYANRKYGDEIDFYYSNGEEAPFLGDRFAGFSYKTTNLDVAKFASALWNLYDKNTDGNFKRTLYDNADNDDVNDDPIRVFEAMRVKVNNVFPNTLTKYKSAYYSLATPAGLLGSSAYIFSNMFYDPVVNQMKSNQIKNLSSNKISDTQLNLSWQHSYYSGSRYYGNYPANYKIYKYINNSYTEIASVPYTQNSLTINSSDVGGIYKVSSYNASGESSFGQTVTVPLSFFVTISGPISLNYNQIATFSCIVTNAPSSVSSYSWLKRYPGNGGDITIESNLEVPPPDYWQPKRIPFLNQFEDQNYFKSAKISGGTISWNDDLDIAPETIYMKLREQFEQA